MLSRSASVTVPPVSLRCLVPNKAVYAARSTASPARIVSPINAFGLWGMALSQEWAKDRSGI